MAENTNRLDYSVLSKRRNDLFGISIVSIVIFHFFLSCQKANVHLGVANTYVALVGRVGVPIFLALSGMGLFFSLSKNSSLKDFYKKRFVRVLIPYVIISVVHYFVRYILIEGKGFGAFIKGVLFIDFFTQGNSQFWFIALVLIMYIIYPLLFHLFKSGKANFLKLSLLVLAVVALNFLLSKLTPALYKNISVMLTRIPAFITGVYLGEKVYHKKPVQIPFWWITGIGSVIFVFFAIRDNVSGIAPPSSLIIRYGETFYGLLWMMALSIILEAVNSAGFSRICALFAAMSLELYMVHVSLRAIMGLVGFPSANWFYYTVMVAIAVVTSLFLQRFDSFLTKKLTAKKKA